MCLDQSFTLKKYPALPFGTYDLGRIIAEKNGLKCAQGKWSYKVPVPVLANATVNKVEVKKVGKVLVKAEPGDKLGLSAWRDSVVACCNPKKYFYAIQNERGDIKCSNGAEQDDQNAFLGIQVEGEGGAAAAPKRAGPMKASKGIRERIAKMGLKHVESYSAHVSEAAFVDEGDFAADAGALEGDAAQDGAGADESAADAPDAALAAFDSSEHLL
eukprot:tig00000204_g17709.t1